MTKATSLSVLISTSDGRGRFVVNGRILPEGTTMDAAVAEYERLRELRRPKKVDRSGRLRWPDYRQMLLAHKDGILAAYAELASVSAVRWWIRHEYELYISEFFIRRFLVEEGVVMAGRADISAKAKARYTEALALRSTGLTYAAIGERMGISPERVRQLCLAGKE